MGQSHARHHVGEGLKLYHAFKYEEAVHKWSKALDRTSNLHEKFLILGYLITASFDRGRHRDMLTYAARQIDLAHEVADVNLRAEGYLNLARSNEMMCEFHKTLTYGRHSLSNETRHVRLPGYIHLCMANAYCGLSDFSSSLQFYFKANKVAQKELDPLLELLVNAGLGHLYISLRDFEKGLFYHIRSKDLARGLVHDVTAKFQRLVAVNMAIAYLKLTRYIEAMDQCEDAMKMALSHNDRAVQAKCLRVFAEIHRKRNDPAKAIPRYDTANNLMAEIGDKLGQVEVLAGLAKLQAAQGQYDQAVETNLRALDLGQNVGNKLIAQFAPRCTWCHDYVGEHPSKLEAYSCGHVYHSSCWARVNQHSNLCRSRQCPVCDTSKR
ncbi:43 kDa receptor-associated protein of the synapse-like isoform X2 [Liolophura sinensis]|uniref:43 kDa receptor-associated protein of the synapse-like isoform X2 n=1 Tax=Liolophura sinensis TaxID=3198878 RepID=UPI003158250C